MTAISVNDLSFAFGTNVILDKISFSLDEKDKLGIIGVNGCGKSTLLRLITGECEPTEGEIYFSKGKTVGVLKQDDAVTAFSDVEQSMTAIEVMYNSFPELLRIEKRLSELEEALKLDNGSEEHLRAVSEYSALNEKFIAEGGLEFRGRCASTLLKMGFDSEAQNRPFSAFSGGQRTRLALSRELCREPDILLLDEPTNHLDIRSREALEQALADFDGTVFIRISTSNIFSARSSISKAVPPSISADIRSVFFRANTFTLAPRERSVLTSIFPILPYPVTAHTEP